MKAKDFEPYILPVGLAVAGYFILKNLGLFGGNAGAANAASVTTSAASGATAALAQATAAGQIATINASEAAAIANNIYTAGVASPVDVATIQNQIIQVNTLPDLLMVIQAFGTKQAGGAMCSLFGGFLSNTCGTYDLPSWIKASVDAGTLITINGYFNAQGINYQF
jgi:hypothetical protein